jgi:uncharacterized protein (UPF0210 family)
MKFYLSTAITRGRREYVDAVKNICDALKEEGVQVLNDRIADPSFPYSHTDRAETIKELHSWLDQADALIAEATISSTGVGCELTQVQMRNKPVLLLYDAHFGFRISDWVTHNPEANVEARPYRDRNEIAKIVKEFVGGVRAAKG